MDSSPVDALRRHARPLQDAAHDHDALLRLIGEAHCVLLGEASHGTHEFYAERAAITRRLIEERDFDAVAIEGDWPDTYRLNRFVRGAGDDGHCPRIAAIRSATDQGLQTRLSEGPR